MLSGLQNRHWCSISCIGHCVSSQWIWLVQHCRKCLGMDVGLVGCSSFNRWSSQPCKYFIGITWSIEFPLATLVWLLFENLLFFVSLYCVLGGGRSVLRWIRNYHTTGNQHWNCSAVVQFYLFIFCWTGLHNWLAVEYFQTGIILRKSRICQCSGITLKKKGRFFWFMLLQSVLLAPLPLENKPLWVIFMASTSSFRIQCVLKLMFMGRSSLPGFERLIFGFLCGRQRKRSCRVSFVCGVSHAVSLSRFKF